MTVKHELSNHFNDCCPCGLCSTKRGVHCEHAHVEVLARLEGGHCSEFTPLSKERLYTELLYGNYYQKALKRLLKC
jgi:hypothetical protein